MDKDDFLQKAEGAL